MIDNLKISVSEQDLPKARRIMLNELIGNNYPHELFKDAIEFAIEYNIFEEHNNKKLLAKSKDWNNQYLENLKVELLDNFSKERFMTTYYVARKLEKDNKYHDLEKKYVDKYSEKCKEYLLRAEVGAAIVGVAAIGIGVWLYNRKKDK